MGSEALGFMPYVNEPFARPSAFEGRFNFHSKTALVWRRAPLRPASHANLNEGPDGLLSGRPVAWFSGFPDVRGLESNDKSRNAENQSDVDTKRVQISL